jgi:hypothetical protein
VVAIIAILVELSVRNTFDVDDYARDKSFDRGIVCLSLSSNVGSVFAIYRV